MKINPRKLFAIIIPQGEKVPIGNIILIVSIIFGFIGSELLKGNLYFPIVSNILWLLVILCITVQLIFRLYDYFNRGE